MTQRVLTPAMGPSPKVVNEIIGGKKAITAGTALQLESALGISALFWLNTQARHDLAQAPPRVRSAGMNPSPSRAASTGEGSRRAASP